MNPLFFRGLSVGEKDGYLCRTGDEFWTNREPVFLSEGDRVILKDGECPAVYVYRPEREKHLIYTYCYQQEGNWAAYDGVIRNAFCGKGSTFRVPRNGYYRFAVTGLPAGTEQAVCRSADVLEIQHVCNERCSHPADGMAVSFWMREELRKAAAEAEAVRDDSGRDIRLYVLADSHYTVNGIWEDTVRSITLLQKEVPPDAVIHLGDFTDGTLPAELVKQFSERQIRDLARTGVPLGICIGNHDYNYFRDNPERLDERACAELYLRKEKPYYRMDLEKKKCRLFFLNSFSPDTRKRYGFSAAQIRWLKRELREVPEDYSLLFFSHVPPLPQFHVFGDVDRGRELIWILEQYEKKHPGVILGFYYGHNHADHVYRKTAFPLIGIGCSKLEQHGGKIPPGAVRPERAENTASQELWDIAVFHRDSRWKRNGADLVRFGAGSSRHIEECR